MASVGSSRVVWRKMLFFFGFLVFFVRVSSVSSGASSVSSGASSVSGTSSACSSIVPVSDSFSAALASDSFDTTSASDYFLVVLAPISFWALNSSAELSSKISANKVLISDSESWSSLLSLWKSDSSDSFEGW